MDTLYSFRRCPYAMRARMALLIGGAPFVLREVVLRDKPSAMLAVSPKGTVPVLVPATGPVIDESLAIMRWALARADPEGWLAGDDAALIGLFDDRFKHHLDRFKYAARHDTNPDEHRAAGLILLEVLERRLADSDNLCGAGRTLTDMAIMPFVRQFAGVDQAWFDSAPVPRVHGWLARHMASPLFGRAMMRAPRWQPGAVAYVVRG